MIAHYDILQNTPEWFQIKWGKIGGTRASQLFTKTDALLIDLISEHIEEFELDEDGYMGADMIRGVELEGEARRQLSEYIGVELFTAGWLQSEEFPLAGISPDGISIDHKIGAEIKSPARKKHTRTVLEDVIPKDDIDQCIHYFTVNPGLEKLYYCSFRPESVKPLFVKELTRETVVDIGKTKKIKVKSDKNGKGEKEYVETVADTRTVAEWVEVSKAELKRIDAEIKSNVERLKF